MAFTPVDYIASYFGWNQFTPALPNFYWDVYSAEERVKKICFELDKLCNYANMLADNINIDHTLVQELQDALANIEHIDELNAKVIALQDTADTIETILENIPDYDEFLELSNQVNSNTQAIPNKVPYPVAPNPRYGNSGQVLTSLGNGATSWENPVAPTDAQAQQYIGAWLDAHPSATTTVEDGAVAFKKFAPDVVNDGAAITDTMIRGTQFPHNLVSVWSGWIDNAYVSTGDGNLVTSQSNYFATDYIQVTPVVSYRANKGRNHVWYDANKTFISGSTSTAIQSGVTAPENAAYIRFTVNKSTDGLNNPMGLYFTEQSLFDDITTVIPNLTIDLTMGQLFDGNNVAYSKNIFLRTGYVDTSGVIVENNNYKYTNPIPITKGTILRHNCRAIALYDTSMNFINRTIYVNTTDDKIYYTNYDGFIVLDIIAANLNATHVYKISPCIATSSLFNNTAYLKDKVPPSNIVGFVSHNLIDVSNCIDGYYIYNVDGSLTANANYFCSMPFPIVAGKTYRCNAGRSYAWFDVNYNYISGAIPIPTEGITAPEGAHYLALSANKTTDNITNPLDWYVAETSVYDTNELHLFTSKAWCYGKKINWIGDSIVDGYDFDEVVASNLGLIKNSEYGINGSTISLNGDGTDSRHALCLRYSDMSDDADIIAVSAGTNDWMYAWAPIGTVESTENTTLYGALKTLCEGLINKYPQKLIFFTTPIKRGQPFASGAGGEYTPDGEPTTPFSKNKYGLTLMDYSDIIKEVCALYSIPVLDLNRESLLNPHITSQQNMFDAALTHPNATGQKIMARRVCGWITQLGFDIEGLA